MQTNADKGEEGVDCSGCQQLSIELRLVVLECSFAAFLIIPTVMALAVLNGPLRLLDVCCLFPWSVAWVHASVRGDSVTSHPSLATHTLLV